MSPLLSLLSLLIAAFARSVGDHVDEASDEVPNLAEHSISEDIEPSPPMKGLLTLTSASSDPNKKMSIDRLMEALDSPVRMSNQKSSTTLLEQLNQEVPGPFDNGEVLTPLVTELIVRLCAQEVLRWELSNDDDRGIDKTWDEFLSGVLKGLRTNPVLVIVSLMSDEAVTDMSRLTDLEKLKVQFRELTADAIVVRPGFFPVVKAVHGMGICESEDFSALNNVGAYVMLREFFSSKDSFSLSSLALAFTRGLDMQNLLELIQSDETQETVMVPHLKQIWGSIQSKEIPLDEVLLTISGLPELAGPARKIASMMLGRAESHGLRESLLPRYSYSGARNLLNAKPRVVDRFQSCIRQQIFDRFLQNFEKGEPIGEVLGKLYARPLMVAFEFNRFQGDGSSSEFDLYSKLDMKKLVRLVSDYLGELQMVEEGKAVNFLAQVASYIMDRRFQPDIEAACRSAAHELEMQAAFLNSGEPFVSLPRERSIEDMAGMVKEKRSRDIEKFVLNYFKVLKHLKAFEDFDEAFKKGQDKTGNKLGSYLMDEFIKMRTLKNKLMELDIYIWGTLKSLA